MVVDLCRYIFDVTTLLWGELHWPPVSAACTSRESYMIPGRKGRPGTRGASYRDLCTSGSGSEWTDRLCHGGQASSVPSKGGGVCKDSYTENPSGIRMSLLLCLLLSWGSAVASQSPIHPRLLGLDRGVNWPRSGTGIYCGVWPDNEPLGWCTGTIQRTLMLTRKVR